MEAADSEIPTAEEQLDALASSVATLIAQRDDLVRAARPVLEWLERSHIDVFEPTMVTRFRAALRHAGAALA